MYIYPVIYRASSSSATIRTNFKCDWDDGTGRSELRMDMQDITSMQAAKVVGGIVGGGGAHWHSRPRKCNPHRQRHLSRD